MLSLSRGGQTIWMSAGRRQDRRRGQRLDRGGQPQRRGRGAGDRVAPDARGHRLHAPRPGPADRRAASETSGKRGGIHNSLTRLLLKPSHLIGGYAQLSFAFNYLGPTGNQRDEVTMIRRRSGGGVLMPAVRSERRARTRRCHMRVMAQMAMVMNLDKCIGCHTCSVTCKQAWTNRTGVEYVWFNNVETRPGQGYPRRYEDQERWRGGWDAQPARPARAQGRRAAQQAAHDLLQPEAAGDPRLLRAVDLRLRDADRRAPRSTRPVARPKSLITGEDMKIRGRPTGTTTSAAPGDASRRPGAQEDRGQGQGRVRADASCSTCRGSASTASTRRAPRRARPARCTSAPRTASCWSTRTGAAAGGCACPAARTRRSTSTTDRQGREVHVLLPAHRGRPADRLLRDLRRPAALHRPGPLRRRQGARGRVGPGRARTSTRRSARCSSTRTTPRSSPRPSARASRTTGSTPRSAHRSTR